MFSPFDDQRLKHMGIFLFVSWFCHNLCTPFSTRFKIFSCLNRADNGRINAFGVDYWTGIIRGGFSSVALPMEIPAEGSHAGVFNMDPEQVNYMIIST